MAPHHAFGIASRAGGVHQRPRIRQSDVLRRLAGAAGREEIFVGAVAGRAGARTEMNETAFLYRDILANLLNHADEFVLHNERSRLAVVDDELHFLADQAKIDRQSHETGFCGCCKNLTPFDAVVGKNCDPVSLVEAETEQGVGEPAGTLVPLLECHRAFEVARAHPAGCDPRMRRKHLSEVQEVFHVLLLRAWSSAIRFTEVRSRTTVRPRS